MKCATNNLDSLPKFLFERENSKLLNGIGNQIFERKIIDGEIITTHKQGVPGFNPESYRNLQIYIQKESKIFSFIIIWHRM